MTTDIVSGSWEAIGQTGQIFVVVRRTPVDPQHPHPAFGVVHGINDAPAVYPDAANLDAWGKLDGACL
jgi:hypothetical protein